MQLSEYDILFLQELLRVNDEDVTIQVAKSLLSPDLKKLFEIDNNNTTGKRIFNTYVEFVPLFGRKKAEDWQK